LWSNIVYEGISVMDHEAVVLQKMTARYLLNELDPDTRDEFEEHYFGCPKCALDVRLGSAFVDEAKIVLAETSEMASAKAADEAVETKPRPPQPNWLAWLRPAIAAPIMAVLLAVVGYQNFVMYPKMEQALKNPQVLDWAPVNIGTYGSDSPAIKIQPGRGFLVFVRIPPQGGYSRRSVDLVNPAGKLEWSLTIPATASQDQWPVAIPGADRQPGTYQLVVRGTDTAGVSKELGRGSFDLKIQQ
jgi:hypothetical protein